MTQNMMTYQKLQIADHRKGGGSTLTDCKTDHRKMFFGLSLGSVRIKREEI